MRVIDRLDMYIKAKNLNDNKVTQQCGLSKGLLYQARAKGNDVGRNSIEKILSTYVDLSRVWLMTGEGEMLLHTDGDIVINNVKANSAQVGKGSFEQKVSSHEDELLKEIKRLNDALDREIENNKFLKKVIENMMDKK